MTDEEHDIEAATVEIKEARRFGKGPLQIVRRIFALAARMRNFSVDKDPEMEVPLRVMLPVTITCALYTLCRLFLYVKDFLSLRAQPIGVYYTVNKFIPFLGD